MKKTKEEILKELIRITQSLILSIQAHPDYVSGEEGDEWHDITAMANDILSEYKQISQPSEVMPSDLILDDLKQYMTNLLYAAYTESQTSDDFDKWVELQIGGIDEYFKSQLKTTKDNEDNRILCTIIVTPEDIKSLIRIRDYFGENDKNQLEHLAFDVLDRAIKPFLEVTQL